MDPVKFNSRRGLWSAASLAGLMLSAPGGRAFEPRDLFAFSVGPVVVRPSLQLMGQYDDNIFYLPEPRVEDYLFLLRPGVDFRIGSLDTQHRLTVSYDMTSRFYAENTSQDSTDHLFSLDASLNWTRLRVLASAGFQYLTGILGGYEANEDGIFLPVGKIDRFYVPLSATVSYALSDKTEPYLRGDLRLTDYDQGRAISRYYDRFESKVFGGVTYKVTPKTRTLLEAFYGQWTIEPNSATQPEVGEVNTAGGSIGVTGQLFTRLTGTAKVGIQTVWDESAAADATEPTGEISFSAPITEKISANLGYRHGVSVSPQGTTLADDPSRRVALVFTQDSLSAGVTGRFGAAHPLTIGITGSYILNGYASSGVIRDSEFYRIGLNTSYQVKLWMSVGASYEYGARSASGSSNSDYDYNRVSVFASFGF
jgi:hypothetical protein